ncbi:MAG: serine/threonine protein kinase [Planctomycetes bacterium]|nr:serine/threonine protein kinase [Planctomycetota bacterium]
MTRSDTETWDRLQRVFETAQALGAGERNAFLDKACGKDPELRKRVEQLLLASGRAEAFLGTPAVAFARPGGKTEGRDDALIGTRIGRYTIKSLLGAGGMGKVYEAEQDNPRRVVALKLMRRTLGTASLRRRFEFEVEILGRLEHPGIARIYEAGATEPASPDAPQPFFAMELVRGSSIVRFAEAQGLSIRRRLELLTAVCDAVQHAHVHGVIHRDLKPDNILVDDLGQPKVLDFGVARATDTDVETATLQTDVGQLVGTIPYMSPEQLAGDPKQLDARSDVYAIGVVAYELLTRRRPHDIEGKTVPEAIRFIGDHDPVTLSSIDRALRGDVETIVARAMEKDKERRYQSAADLAADIRRYLADEPIAARPPSTTYQLGKFAKRHKGVVTGAAMTLAVLVVGIIATTELARRARAAESQALSDAASARAITTLLQETLASGDPQTGRGPDYTVREALDAAAARVDTELADQPEIESALRRTIGATYVSLSMFKEAEPHLTRALDLCRAIHHRDHVDVAEGLSALATVRSFQGDAAAAVGLIRESLEMSRRLFGPSHALVAKRTRQLGLYLKAMSRYDEASPLLQDAIDLSGALGDDGVDELIQAINDLAHLRLLTGRNDDAFDLLRRAYELSLQEHGEDHLRTALIMGNLSHMYRTAGDLDEAEKLIRRALAVRRAHLPKDHQDVASSMVGLAQLLLRKGSFEEAVEQFREVLAIDRRRLPPNHRYIITDVTWLAQALIQTEEVDEAEAVLRQTIELQTERGRLDHPDTLPVRFELAMLVKNQGRLAEAEPMYELLVEATRRVHGPTHPETLDVMNSMGRLLHAMEKYDEAERVFRETIAAQRSALGDDHPDTMATMNNLGLLLIDKGALDDAEAVLYETLERRQRVLSDDHPDTIGSMNNLGAMLLAAERYDEAEILLRQTLDIRRRVLGPAHTNTMNTATNLADAMEKQGRLEEATDCLRAAVSALETERGRGHPAALRMLVNLARMLHRAGKLEQALDLIGEAARIAEESLPAGHVRTVSIRFAYGELLFAAKRYVEAKPHLLFAHTGLRRIQGEDHPRTREAAALLAELYTELNQPPDAETPNRE